MISQDYSERFYPLDGSQRVMQAELARLARDPHARPRVWLHRQGPRDVQHPEYRHVCYELPRIAERLSLLMLQENARWLSVNLYRARSMAASTPQPLPGSRPLRPWSCRPCVCITRGRRCRTTWSGWCWRDWRGASSS
jgi:hypothetical protein